MSRAALVDPALAFQAIAAVIAIAAIAFAPPARGVMRIVPLLPTARPAVAVTRAGGAIIALGAIPGSIVVAGDRALILPAVLAGGSIALATDRRGCGAEERRS